MNEQPEALRIADELLALHGATDIDERAAAKLRSQHNYITTLEAALRQAVDALDLYLRMDTMDENYLLEIDLAPKAIAAAEQALWAEK